MTSVGQNSKNLGDGIYNFSGTALRSRSLSGAAATHSSDFDFGLMQNRRNSFRYDDSPDDGNSYWPRVTGSQFESGNTSQYSGIHTTTYPRYIKALPQQGSESDDDHKHSGMFDSTLDPYHETAKEQNDYGPGFERTIDDVRSRNRQGRPESKIQPLNLHQGSSFAGFGDFDALTPQVSQDRNSSQKQTTRK